MERSVPKLRINALFAKYKYPILVVLVGLGLMLLPTREEPAEEVVPTETVAAEDLGAQLEAVLSQIEGAGQVRVLLTEDSGRETLYQTDSQSESDGTAQSRSDDTVLVEDGSKTETGLVRQVLEPKYRGAVILCQGADNASVRLAIVQAVSCVTGLGADRISVVKMK